MTDTATRSGTSAAGTVGRDRDVRPTRTTGHRVARVLIVTDHVGGGTGQHILSLLAAFDARRVSVTVLSEGHVRAMTPGASDVHRIPPLAHLHRFPFAQLHSLRAILRQLRRAPVDVLHVYGFWPIMYGRLLRAAGLVPSLVENRECDGHAWGTLAHRALRMGRSLADRVICVSSSVARHVLADEAPRPGAVVVIENGVHAQPRIASCAEARRMLGVPEDAFVIGTVASHLDRPVKGIACLVDAMPAILQEEPSAWCVLVGDCAPDGTVAGHILPKSIRSRVVLTGYRDDMSRLYAALDVLALPSLSEGLSIALLEAMSSGVPAVATNVGGTPEVIVHGQSGVLIEPGDPGSLARAIISLLHAPARRRAMGIAARRRFIDAFSIERAARRYERLYLALVPSTSSGP